MAYKAKHKNHVLKKYILYKENPYCHWCGTKTVLFNYKCGNAVTEKGTKYPNNTATLDHLFEKNHQKRHIYKFVDSKIQSMEWKNFYVLSCRKCNSQRSNKKKESECPI